MILIAGFLGAFGALFSMFAFNWPAWLLLVVWLPITLVACLGLMRPAKGLMVAAYIANNASEAGRHDLPTPPSNWKVLPKDRRFPIGLTIATLIAFAILCVPGRPATQAPGLEGRPAGPDRGPGGPRRPSRWASCWRRVRKGEDVAWNR